MMALRLLGGGAGGARSGAPTMATPTATMVQAYRTTRYACACGGGGGQEQEAPGRSGAMVDLMDDDDDGGGGGGNSDDDEGGDEARIVVVRPELLVGALLCPALRRDEALLVRGAARVELMLTAGPGAAAAEPADASVAAAGGEGEAAVATISIPSEIVLLIDFVGAAPPPIEHVLKGGGGDDDDGGAAMVAERWTAGLRRDLEKAYCAFAAGAAAVAEDDQDDGANGLEPPPSPATRCVVVHSAVGAAAEGAAVPSSAVEGEGGEEEELWMALEAAVQWLAASEAGCELELRWLPSSSRVPSSRGAAAGQQGRGAAAQACTEAVRRELRAFEATVEALCTEQRLTVGWVWARVSEYVEAVAAAAAVAADGGRGRPARGLLGGHGVGSVWGWMEGALRAGRPFPRGTAPAD
eukprot:COSAG01_NODE_8288_length_2842_cov_3.406489_1_plen_410_part_10